MVAWGSYDARRMLPSGLSNVVAIAAGGYHSLALSGLPPGMAAPDLVGPRFLVATVDRPFHHRIMAKNGADDLRRRRFAARLGAGPGHRPDHGPTGASRDVSLVLSATNSWGRASGR